MYSARETFSIRRDHHLRMGTRLGLLAVLFTMVTLGSLPGAHAHSELDSSSPAENARLDAPPREVRLVFNQQITAEFATLTLTVGDGQPRQLEPEVRGRRVVAAVPEAIPGGSAGTMVRWQLGYRVVSADGHPITGQVQFRAANAMAPAADTPGATPPSPSASSAQAEPTPRPAPRNEAAQSGASDDGQPIVATLVVGGFALSVALGAAAWLARGRRGASEQ